MYCFRYHRSGQRMAFTFAAFAYIVALIIDAFLIFFAIFHVSVRERFQISVGRNY